MAAQNCPGLPWPVVAAIGKAETDHNRAPGTSEAGAVGPMQFLPATWEEYQADGDGDGVADIEDEEDAIDGAVRLLCPNGGDDPATLQDAILAYNHSEEYVDRGARDRPLVHHRNDRRPLIDGRVEFRLHSGEWRNLADAQDSGSCVRKDVGVQVPPRPPPLSLGRLS